MADSNNRRRRARLVFLVDTAIVVLALAGLAAFGLARLGSGGPPVRVSGTLRESEASLPLESRVPRGSPESVRIPSLGVDAQLVRLGLNADGTLQTPASFSDAGWYKLGPKPGEPGAAVVVGHVDSTEGPAVFFRLGQLSPGAIVRVAWPNGRGVRFRVYAVREYRKTAFPTALVYGQTRAPELRLITCGGPFDQATGHYLDNVVVFARYAV